MGASPSCLDLNSLDSKKSYGRMFLHILVFCIYSVKLETKALYQLIREGQHAPQHQGQAIRKPHLCLN